MHPLRLSLLLLPAVTTLAFGRLPESLLKMLEMLSREPRSLGGLAQFVVNDSRTTAMSPVDVSGKRAGIPPQPLPFWAKRSKEANDDSDFQAPPFWAKRGNDEAQDTVNDSLTGSQKRSESIEQSPPRGRPPMWAKRSPHSVMSSKPPVKRDASLISVTNDVTSIIDDVTDDEFGVPLTPDDFQAAVRLEADALLSAPDAGDPTQLAGLYEGDIAGVSEEGKDLETAGGDSGGRVRNAVRNRHQLWPGGEIPYTIASTFSDQERAVIAAAAQQLSQRSCLRLVPRSGQRDYVHIKKGRGCSSDVGRFGGRQELSLGNGCVYRGVVAHELLHAAGFWHEQSRADRDNHVIIHRENIRAGMAYNFDKKPWSQTLDLGEPYDVGSVLHYGPTAFAADPSRPTITALVPSSRMGQRDGPSDLDIAKLNRLYGCDEVPTEAPVTGAPECRDTDGSCQFWAENGECQKNPNWMGINCALSCGTCGDCEDRSGSCAGWAADNQCTANWSYMSVFCRRACGLCGDGAIAGCGDTASQCSEWAKAGECAANPDYMAVHCRKACGVC
ncbi:zinc metalloproteinase nas-13-like [Amphibalanus amphitrite]|uniref:zinc metalloproteinase nas-13-like n=1 Tax=Amphibalanus amphitrite TaxID=1232801 RepID=UPI001C8FECFB|nr:zinc metalloproteinase nas-13-like [Amphibalanus amphitrite]